MNFIKKNLFDLYLIQDQFIKIRFFAVKTFQDVLKRDSEIHEFVSKTQKPKNNFLASIGIVGTGALGIKKLLKNEKRYGNIIVARRPYPIYYFNDLNGVHTSVRNVACGYGFTLFSGRSKPSWKVYGCGLNNDSQLGLQDADISGSGYELIIEPRIINLPNSLDKITHIACGRAHSIVVGTTDASDGNSQIIFSFGNNIFGQCGREIIENEIYSQNAVMHKIELPETIRQVECGELSTYFLTNEGRVYCCGSNSYGQLANSDIERRYCVAKVGGKLDGVVIKEISSRCNTVLALTENGEVWAWGDNEHGLIFSDTNASSVTEPCKLTMPAEVGKIVRVSAGNSVCAVINENGHVYTWGQFMVGLGPNQQSCALPTKIPPGLFGGGAFALNNEVARVVEVKCGVEHCLAITSSGSLFFWGKNGPTKGGPQTFPMRMALSFNAKRIFTGADHSIIMGSPDM